MYNSTLIVIIKCKGKIRNVFVNCSMDVNVNCPRKHKKHTIDDTITDLINALTRSKGDVLQTIKGGLYC